MLPLADPRWCLRAVASGRASTSWDSKDMTSAVVVSFVFDFNVADQLH